MFDILPLTVEHCAGFWKKIARSRPGVMGQKYSGIWSVGMVVQRRMSDKLPENE
jgi:hypothetical protein